MITLSGVALRETVVVGCIVICRAPERHMFSKRADQTLMLNHSARVSQPTSAVFGGAYGTYD